MSRRLPTGAWLALTVCLAGCAGASDGPIASDAVAPPTAPSSEPSGLPRATNPPPGASIDDRPSATTPGASIDDPPTSAVETSAGRAGDAACATALPVRERIALLVWPAVYSDDWTTALETVERERVGGVVLMEPSGWGPDEVTSQLARLDAAAPRGLVVATDEEGGVVQRLAVFGELASQQSVSERDDLDGARQLIADHGRRIASSGVDMVLGPVVDVVPRSGNVPLSRSRFFTGEPATVAAYGRAYIEGWQASGLLPVVKHFPGHGAASGDTHDEAGVTPDLDELEQWDLVPFRALADTGAAVMVGHLTVPGLTDGLPATQSERAVRYLRDDLGYGDALVMTDALGMQAVGLPEDEAAVRALVAGIDVVIFTATGQTTAVIDAIERAVGTGTLTDERITLSAARVLRMLDPQRTGCGSG